MRAKTTDAAVGKWEGVLMALGLDESFLQNRHGPCPACGGKDRYRFDNKDGKGTYYCSGCGAGDGMSLAMKITGLDFASVAAKIDGIIGNVEPDRCANPAKKDPAVRLRKIQFELLSPDGVTPVRRYLRNRGLQLPAQAVGYHPAMPYYDNGELIGKYPAMVSVFRNAQGKPISYHLTMLTGDGQKANLTPAKKILPPTERLNGGAIRLFPEAEVMGVAEGIETALAASKLHGLPVWACATAVLLEAWQPPEGVKSVTVFGDNDKNFAGHAAAYRLANRLAMAGIQAEVMIPPAPGDWNDVLMGAA